MRATTSTFGALTLVLATAGIIRATGADIDLRIFVVITLLAVAFFLVVSAFMPTRAEQIENEAAPQDVPSIPDYS